MYENIESRVKNDNRLSNDFTCLLGVRQGECLSPFLFSMYVNDLEEKLAGDGFKGVEVGMLKLLLLLYADDIVGFFFFRKCRRLTKRFTYFKRLL